MNFKSWLLNEMPLITLKGKTAYGDESALKDLDVETLSNNIVFFRQPEGNENYFIAPGSTWIYFMDSEESAQEMKEGKIPMLMVPRGAFMSGGNPITDIWAKKHAKPGTEKILGMIEGHTSEDKIYIDMMTVRPKYRRNSITTKMIQYAKRNFPNAKVTFSSPTPQGEKFINSFKENFYEFYLILEGQAEDFVNQNPELQPAYDQGVKNINYLRWLLKAQEQEPLEDIIPLVFAFEKNKVRLPIKDIFQYNSPGSLRQDIENLGQSKSKAKEEVARQLKDNETTRLGEFGDWMVVMPHTRESSCQWGKGTTWCTAATKSGNLFLNYVGRKKENIVLYYLINTKEDPVQNPNAKISIGFINGEPKYGGNGGLTVNAKNTGLDANEIKGILGNQYDLIMSRLKEHSKSIEGKHPAKEQMEKIAQSKDPTILDDYLKGMKPEEEKEFIDALFRYELSIEVIGHIAKNYELDIHSIFYGMWKNDSVMDRNEVAKTIVRSKEGLTTRDIQSLFEYTTGDKDELITLIIEHKKELSNDDVGILIKNSTNEQEIAKLIVQKQNSKDPDGFDSRWILRLIDQAKYEFEIIAKIIIQNKKELTGMDVMYLLHRGEQIGKDKDIARFIIQNNKMTDDNESYLKKYLFIPK